MWEELGISGGTAIIILIALYFIIKWAVKNGIKQAYRDITEKETADDIKTNKIIQKLQLEDEKKIQVRWELILIENSYLWKQGKRENIIITPYVYKC